MINNPSDFAAFIVLVIAASIGSTVSIAAIALIVWWWIA
jgi:hypothetical protein